MNTSSGWGPAAAREQKREERQEERRGSMGRGRGEENEERREERCTGVSNVNLFAPGKQLKSASAFNPKHTSYSGCSGRIV